MRAEAGILATFHEPEAAAAAIRALRRHGFEVRSVMAAPFPEVMKAIGNPRSGIDQAALAGALTGAGLGVLLTVATSVAWPLVTGGMPVVSVPPFVVVIFETTILGGCLGILAALVAGSWRGSGPSAFPADAGPGAGVVGVFAYGGDGTEGERILVAHGAEGVRHVP
jgi:hypothetical protein